MIATPRVCHVNQPMVKQGLFFQKCIAAWSLECEELKRELAIATKEKTTPPG